MDKNIEVIKVFSLFSGSLGRLNIQKLKGPAEISKKFLRAKGKTMTDKDMIKEVVNSVAMLQDMRQWERLENYFVKKPFVDNKSISGEMPAVIPKKRLIDGWRREIGSYFYSTRHFIRRLAVRMLNSRRAKVTTDVENVHYVADRGERYAWTVRGTIDYILVKTTNGTWKISQMIFRMTDQAVRPISA